MRALFVLAFWLLASTAQAATLLWDAPAPGVVSPVAVERSTTATGPFTTIATLPAGDTSYILTPGSYGFYRVRYTALATSLPSNVVQFSLDLYTGLVTDRLTALETRVTALETVPVVVPPPAPSSNLTTRQIDADHMEVTGTNCLSLRTTGTGLRRVVECVH